eukprot:1243562-Pleurochrysis_carterae.AAC.1
MKVSTSYNLMTERSINLWQLYGPFARVALVVSRIWRVRESSPVNQAHQAAENACTPLWRS